MKAKLIELIEWMRENKCPNFLTASKKNKGMREVAEYALSQYHKKIDADGAIDLPEDEYLKFKIDFVIKLAESL